MIELQQVVQAYEAIARAGRQCVVATVVQTSGSTYRRAGARMLMTEGLQLAGAISGGCLEGDLVRKAWWRTSDGPCLVRYDATIEDDDGEEIRWGFGLGCNGVVDVLLERLTPGSAGDPLAFLRRCLQTRQAGVLATVIGGAGVGQRLSWDERGLVDCSFGDGGLAAEVARDAAAARDEGRSRHASYRDGAVRVFHEVVLPPQSLLVCGGGYDVLPLVLQAKVVGWHVVVVDQQARAVAHGRLDAADRVVVVSDAAALVETVAPSARTAAVVMTHNYERDRELVGALLASPVGYLGVLGPRARTERILAQLERDGQAIGAGERARLHAPVGIDLGAEGADEIALAIVAEVQAVMARRSARSLRELAPAAVELPAVRSACAAGVT